MHSAIKTQFELANPSCKKLIEIKIYADIYHTADRISKGEKGAR